MRSELLVAPGCVQNLCIGRGAAAPLAEYAADEIRYCWSDRWRFLALYLLLSWRSHPQLRSSMSIQHTVSFALIHPAGSAEEDAFLDRATRVLTAIDGVQDFTINRQVSTKSDHHWQFSMRFESPAAYEAYDTHPAHQDFVASYWLPEVARFQELDFAPFSRS